MMSSNGFTGLAMVFGTGMAIMGGIQLGGMSSSAPPFKYASASLQERQAFLESHAQPLRKKIRRSLFNPSGVGPKLSLRRTEVDAARRRITFNIRVSGGRLVSGSKVRAVKNKAYRKYCPSYMRSQLGKNQVTIMQRFFGRGNRTLMRIPLSSSVCSRYVVASR